MSAPAVEGLTRRLARFAATLSYDDLPEDVVEMAKRLTLDSLGTALAGTALGAGCREVVDLMSVLGGKPESTIIGHDAKVSAPNAAFANGALVHALNYDAFGKEAGHTGVVCFVAPLALAQSVAPVSGRRFLTAVVAAAEVNARITQVKGGQSLSNRILAGQYFSYFGATAGAGRILDLDPAQMHSAFGLALMQASGSRQVVIGSDVPAKAIYGAFPNHGAVLAALLAKGGLRADVDALEGQAGLFGLTSDGHFDAEALVDGLGERFAFLRTQFKPWPTSVHVFPFIEASLELVTHHGVTASEVDSIEVTGAGLIRDWFEPLHERRKPSNPAAAGDSAIFGTAKALAHGRVTLNDFTEYGLTDQVALALAERTTYRIDERVPGGVVKIRTKAGREFETAVERPLDRRGPLDSARLKAKFRDCCSYVPSLCLADVESLMMFVDGLEGECDVSALGRKMASTASAGAVRPRKGMIDGSFA